jgi:hypothetical protein
MLGTLSYAGVCIQEVPSGIRTITGVATSVAAFVGRALRGPVDKPVPIASYAEFERTSGGLWRESWLGYAVRDYYLKGGGRACPAARRDRARRLGRSARLGVSALQALDAKAAVTAERCRDRERSPIGTRRRL